MTINSYMVIGQELPEFTEKEIKNEPMFFNCTYSYAYENGGEPTKAFLKALPVEFQNDSTIIDSRVHMLMKGWYPCIPGFHHDDVERGKNGQPNYSSASYRPEHALVLYNGDICPTQFALGTSDFSDPEKHDIVYKHWHKEVLEKIGALSLKLKNAPQNRVVYFDDRTWHQGQKALENGWRLFIRASWHTGRIPTNELRKQVQVYMDNPMEGW